MKKLLFKIMLFSPLVLLLAMVQYFSRSLPALNKTEQAISQALMHKQNVAFSFDYDDRLVQKYYIETNAEKKDIVVLGSSRSAKIDNGLFKGRAFFNHNVTGADLEDYISIYQLYRSRQNLPTTILVGIDPWILDKNNGKAKRWLNLSAEFYRLTKEFPLSKDLSVAAWYYSGRLRPVFSLPHFQYSVKKILQNSLANAEKKKIATTTEFESFLPVVHSDGSISDSLKIRSKNADEVASEITQAAVKCPASLDGALSKEKEFLFVNFLQTLKQDGVTVIFLLVPFHPLTYAEITSNPQCDLSLEMETYFRQIAKENNIQILGSYNPDAYGLRNDLFYDSIHPKRAAIEAIFKKEGLLK